MKHTSTRKSLTAQSAADFADWLNSSESNTEAIAGKTALARFSVTVPRAETFARDRIRPLVELTLDFVRESQRQKRESARFATFQKYVDKIDPLLEEIAKLHPMQPIFSDRTFVIGVPTFEYELIPPKASGRGDVMFTQTYQNGRTLIERLNHFFHLASEDVFAAFHRCALPSCGKYFHALRPERRYCSKGCQRDLYEKHPLRMKKNAADQKVYYYTRKVLELAKLKAESAADRKAHGRAETDLKSAKRAQKKLELNIRAASKER